MVIIGFDPGRDKCGLAVMNTEGDLLYHQVLESTEAITTVISLVEQFKADILVIGNQTTSKSWQKQLKEVLPSIPIVEVNERNSTLEARDRYWMMYPPQGLTRLLPAGMRLPPRAIDDIVAILLIERYLKSTF
ncbi:MAG: pre-16S rRNA-processing nuclease YqgF [Gloeocapsa sp. DLM2.Bin57]|nr:MAG: pre-16S rRNA-processing nuclease YqgF [Gloeocapsa sp. DLM2.Bin57]